MSQAIKSGPIKLRGALANLEKRCHLSGNSLNEFGLESGTEFNATSEIQPPLMGYDESTRVLLSLRIGASYTYFRSDPPGTRKAVERTAMQALCRCLYQDVLDDLMIITRAVGNGKRRAAMVLLGDLYLRLSGSELGEL